MSDFNFEVDEIDKQLLDAFNELHEEEKTLLFKQ